MTKRSMKFDRRKFIKTGAVLGGSLAFNLGHSENAFGFGNSKVLKVGLIGCGGRGAGAASQALAADPECVLTAMGDVFPDRLDESYNELAELYPSKVKVGKEARFIGFDAYRKVIDSGVDVVLLTTPPVFRPEHMAAAVDAGKHVFCEKPVAVDAQGVRTVLKAARKAMEKNLSVVSGFCLRYDFPKRELFGRVLNGDLGDVRAVSTIRNGGLLWTKPRQQGWTDMEYQLRNWLYYNWLSGDFITEMMVHSLDMMSWALGDKPPLRATGTGGRQVRTDPIYGNIYDHFAIEYEYPDNVRGFHISRQQDKCSNVNKVEVVGTRGMAFVSGERHEIVGETNWTFTGQRNNMYQTEHDELFASIRAGKPKNDGEWMVQSTMLGIMGRMVGYSGQTVTWEEALNSDETFGPPTKEYRWDLIWAGPQVAKPGLTKPF